MNLCLEKKTEFSLLYPRWAGSVDLHAVFFGPNFWAGIPRTKCGPCGIQEIYRLAHNAQCAICRLLAKVNWSCCIPATSLGIFTPTTICSHDPFTFTHCNHEQNIGRWSRMMIPSQCSDGLWGLSPVLVSVLVRLAIRPFLAVSII